jgi:hypothetical protein
LNILEAYVDAHFYDYDISEDLSVSLKPTTGYHAMFPANPAPGLKLTLKF